MKSIKLSNYIKITKPNYVYYKLTPNKNIRNYSSDKIATAVVSTYKNLCQRINIEDKKLFFTHKSKVVYFTYLSNNKVEFYFIIPSQYEPLFKDKISEVWKGINCERVNQIPMFSKDCLKYYLDFKKEDAFSIAIDKRNNYLLSALTNTLSVMEKDDKIGILYNFMPTEQIGWKATYNQSIEKFKAGLPIDKTIGAKFILKWLTAILISVGDIATDILLSMFGNVCERKINKEEVILLPETIKKKNDLIINSQILILSESDNKNRQMQNILSATQSFDVLSSDNEFRSYKLNYNKEINYEKFKFNRVATFKANPKECQNFLSLPGKEIIEEHHLSCIDVLETEVPKELQSGIIRIGNSMFRGTETPTYLCNDFELRNLPLCITGSNRSGKSTYMENITYDCLNNGECVIAFDFCGNCEFSDKLSNTFKDRSISVDCSDFNNLQGLGYNEIKPSSDTFIQYRNAKMQSIQLSTLLNSVNDDDKSLKAKMDRYLEAASLVVFINNGSITNVFQILQNHVLRHNFIDRIPPDQKDNLKEYVDYLLELDDIDRQGEIIGTRFHSIEGIIDRLNVLKRNTYIELMLKKDCQNNFDLYTEIQKSQLICIRMPECMFSTAQEKDIFCTYWFSKLWLTLQLRKNDIERDKHTKVNIMVDELYQVARCQSLISSKLSQMPKFTAKMIVSCHYLNQIAELREELRACNSSYMLLQGSNISNFESLKYELTNLNYSTDDLLNLKRYHSLNLLSYEQGYWAGITALPKPLK